MVNDLVDVGERQRGSGMGKESGQAVETPKYEPKQMSTPHSKFDTGRKFTKPIGEGGLILVLFRGDDGVSTSTVWVWKQATIFDHSKHYRLEEFWDFESAKKFYERINNEMDVVRNRTGA